jgi:HAMP domain-containing protein/tRNA A-37 threonylcarbamoyl transferase component Bud32
MTNAKPIERIGRYQVECLAGEGATAMVYRARDPEIGRTVAIKVLKQEAFVDQDYLNRFQREAQSAGAISHPNIVTIYDVGKVADVPYITMEFLDEQSLKELLASGTRLPFKSVVRIAIQLASALDYAHQRGVIHRDVKPANILLIGGGETVKLTDFGIARMQGGGDLQRTEVGLVMGTPQYMSPEQVAGHIVDGRSDLFSLGSILYELLTGSKPFDDANVARLMLQILEEEPEPIATKAPGTPVGMQRIVRKLMNKRPERRYETGAQLVKALERELDAANAREEEARRNKFMPLRVKLALSSGAMLAVIFVLCMSVVYVVEARIVRNQVFDAGASLAKFVAVHSAVPVLDQNWVPLRLFVDDAQKRSSLDYLVVTDHDNFVQASTEANLVGKPFQRAGRNAMIATSPDVNVSSVAMHDGRNIFLFDTPILFQKTEIGHIFLGIDQAGVARVLGTMLWLMTMLGLFAVCAVASLSFLFARFIARPLRALQRALQDFGAGDMDRRISETRNDEFGSLFDAFNSTAEHLQGRVGKGEDVVARLTVPPRAVPEVPPNASAETTLVFGSPAR